MSKPILEKIKDLALAYGWIEIKSKNPYMVSFKKEETDFRLNLYFTKMTVTVQSPEHAIQTYRNVGEDLFEQIVQTL